jgi:hypothetical protein
MIIPEQEGRTAAPQNSSIHKKMTKFQIFFTNIKEIANTTASNPEIN